MGLRLNVNGALLGDVLSLGWRTLKCVGERTCQNCGAGHPLRAGVSCLALEHAECCGEGGFSFGSLSRRWTCSGHEDVAEDVEVVTGAEFFERVLEGEAGAIVVEEWEPLVTTEGDEVVVAEGVIH